MAWSGGLRLLPWGAPHRSGTPLAFLACWGCAVSVGCDRNRGQPGEDGPGGLWRARRTPEGHCRRWSRWWPG